MLTVQLPWRAQSRSRAAFQVGESSVWLFSRIGRWYPHNQQKTWYFSVIATSETSARFGIAWLSPKIRSIVPATAHG